MPPTIWPILEYVREHLNIGRMRFSYLFLLTALAINPWSSVNRNSLVVAQDRTLDSFVRHQLTDVYYSEGIGTGDLDRDGHADIVYGPYWFAGPDFKNKFEMFEPIAQPRERYSNHFFAWVHDFNGDGWKDVVTVGFPGKPAYLYENPRQGKTNQRWNRHEVVTSVSNESPHFVDLVGDAQPELVCSQDGYFGYASPSSNGPLNPWKFVRISEKVAPIPFGHGLGVGDVNGDQRKDVLTKDGWYEQPATHVDGAVWRFHAFSFTKAGGADMVAYDVDGDGDNDIITSLTAHDFGLAWFEHIQQNGVITFRRHLIMGERPAENAYGLVFTELHSLNLFDIDGDGLRDIVTGKTYWSHHTKSPMWDAGAVVVWFKLIRTPEGVDWRPFEADRESGIGRQLVVSDVNQDGLADILAGGMKGAHVLTHVRRKVSEQEWQNKQPKRMEGFKEVPIQEVSKEPKRVTDALECEQLKILGITSGSTHNQQMSSFTASSWSGDQQLFWRDVKLGDKLTLEVDVKSHGDYELLINFTKARDYGIVQILLDDQKLGPAHDLFHSSVVTTGEISLGKKWLAAGTHRLTAEVVGANQQSLKPTMIGLDYILLRSFNKPAK